MKPRLIATYRESKEGLFQSLRSTFDKFLARDPIDWKRSFGRPSRNVFIQLKFDCFDPHSVILEESWLLCNRPFLHTFWIDCDLETYKASVKELVLEWLTHLREKDIQDWLIVVVVYMDNRVKNKLLRNSVYDKVKNDFCSKQVERCILLSEPYKLDSKSLESYNQVASRMRMLVVDSITRILDRFEENMRSQRERRIEQEWNFCSYFLLQEELAFMYEMIGLYEDAMIQYDELDALFTQFILNSALAEPAPWLELMTRNIPTRWGGSCLCQPIDDMIRNLISLNKCSILDLRSYLFGRQGHLLVQLSRISELVRRSVPFIHNCIREVKLLQIQLPSGAIDCWTFLSCMEVLKFCPLDNKLDSEDARTIAYGASELWNLATQKAIRFGRLCGLITTDSEPIPDKLKVMETLLPGLVHAAGESEHLNGLLKVFSFKEPFVQFYLDLSERCICYLKHVGRIRSAKFVGKELADFYIMTGDYKKAEGYLVDLMKMYKTEGWEMLANDVRQKVSECQKFLNQTLKYCRTCVNISSSSTVPLQVRKKYLTDVIQCSKDQADLCMERLRMRCSPAFVVSLKIPSVDVMSQWPTRLCLEIFSNFPSSLILDEITLSFKSRGNPDEDKDSETNRKHKRNVSTDSAFTTTQKLKQRSHSRQNSEQFETRWNSLSSILGGFELFNKINETIKFNFQPIDLQSSVQYLEDGDQFYPVSSSLQCRSPLKRSLSSPKSQRLSSIGHDEVDVILKKNCVSLNVGKNSIELDGVFQKGGSYDAKVAILKLNQLDFVQTFYFNDSSVDVKQQQIDLNLTNKSALVAGFSQTFELHSSNCASKLMHIQLLEICVPDGLVLCCGDLSSKKENKITLFGAMLENFKKTHNLFFTAFASLDEWSNEEILTKQITLKSPDHIDKTYDLTFNNPFSLSHKIFASYSKKFVQVVVSSKYNKGIKITKRTLNLLCNSTSLKDLNGPKTMLVQPDSTLSFVWQIDGGMECSGDLKFSMSYQDADHSGESHQLGCHFHFGEEKIKIVYCIHVKEKILMQDEWTMLRFSITKSSETLSISQLFYEIAFNPDDWQLFGDTSGKVGFVRNRANIKVKARPVTCKQVSLPKLTLLHNRDGKNLDGILPSAEEQPTKIDSKWVFDASEVSAVAVKPQDSSPPFQVDAEIHSY